MRLLSKHSASQLIFLASFLNRTAMASSLITSQTTPVTLQFISVKSPQATMYRGSWPVSLSEPSCAGASVISSSFTVTNPFMKTTFRKNFSDFIVTSCYRRGYQQLSSTRPKSSCISTPHSYLNLHPFNSPTSLATGRLLLSQIRPLEGRNGRVITPVATTGTELGLPHQVEQQDEPGLVSFLISERAKVVIMVALAMALCNADRVVMSVAIVPMAAAHGWSQSFSGVVQVRLLIHFSLPVLMVLLTFCKKCHHCLGEFLVIGLGNESTLCVIPGRFSNTGCQVQPNRPTLEVWVHNYNITFLSSLCRVSRCI